jgi:hypothetical protein
VWTVRNTVNCNRASPLLRCFLSPRAIMRPEPLPEAAAEFLAKTLAATYPALPTVLFGNTLWKNTKRSHDQPTPRMKDVALDFFYICLLKRSNFCFCNLQTNLHLPSSITSNTAPYRHGSVLIGCCRATPDCQGDISLRGQFCLIHRLRIEVPVEAALTFHGRHQFIGAGRRRGSSADCAFSSQVDYRRRRRSSRPKRLARPKITTVVDVEIPLSARWRALPPQHCSVPHYAGRRRDAGPDSCRPLRLVFWQVPL